MAIDALARGMAAAAGGGGGGVDVGIDAGTGIRFTGTDPVTIINTGVTAVTTPGDNDIAEDGTIKVANPGAENSADRVHYVKVKGINNAAFKDVDTVINDTKATSTNVPTTKAVYDELEKKLEADLDTTAFTNDNDHVPSSKLVKEKLDDKLEDSLTINGVSYDSTNDSYTLDGDDIDVTGYTAISSGTEEDVAATDSVNDAIAKVEYKADNRIPTDNIDADFPVTPEATHVLASTVASATFQGTGTAGVSPKKGLVPAPGTITGTETRFLKADGTWATPPNTEYSEGTGIDISNAGVISNTGVTHIENSDPADDNVANGTFKVMENGTAKWIAIKGLDDAAYMDVVTSIPATPSDTDLPTSQAVAEYVDDAIDALPKPMVFKGGITLTADSTDTTLCSLTLPSGITTIKEGYTFKVVAIASSPVYTGNIKVGDTLYADKDNAKTTADWVVDTDWTITPSGDEPSGTVTEVTASDGIIAYDNTTHGSSISDNGNIKLALVTNHTTTANAGDASSTANRSYPLALDSNGKLATNVPWTDTTYEFADSYNASTNKGATVATVTNAIGELDVTGTNAFGAGKTISAWSETDGKVNITSQDISITGSQISDIDTTMPATAADTKVPSTKLVKTQLSGKQDTLTFDGTYNASTNKAATVSTVTNAINALDVTEVSVGSTKTINKISQTDGKISVTTTDIRSASTSQTGIVQLNNTLTSTSTTQAATANAVKAVNDKAETNQSNILYTREVVAKNLDDGCKNYATINDKTFVSGTSRTLIIPCEPITGNIHIYCKSITSTDTDSTTCGYVFNYTDGTTGTLRQFNRGEVINIEPEIISKIVESIGIFPADSWEHSVGDAVTIENFMITTKAQYELSSDYEPYALPNYDLTRLQSEDRAGLIECVDGGAKNLLNNSLANGTVSQNVTATVASNGSFTLSGTASTSTDATFPLISNTQFKAGTYVGTGCPKNGDIAKYRIDYVVNDSTVYRDYGDGVEFTLTSAANVRAQAVVYRNTAAPSGTWYPMICTKAAFGVSQKFVPFGNDPFYQVPINHNMIYRGRNLGATFTDAQHTALSSGNFTDLYLGDYWTKTVTIPAGTYTGGDSTEVTVPAQTNITLKAVIADFDTFYAGYASSYAGINTHHAAVIVTGFSNVVWNDTNSTAGGYVASLIHKWLVGSALPQIETWFGSAKVLSHQKLLTNAITGDAASGWAWSSQKISLLSENQMYGSKVWGGSKVTNGGYEPGEAFKHLNVFNHIDANLLFGNRNIWLRDIASAVGAASLNNLGVAHYRDASYTGVAPAALILLS